MTLDELPLTTEGYMVGDYISTLFVTTPAGGDVALPVFPVGQAQGDGCHEDANGSCDEPMFAPTTGLTSAAASNAVLRPATTSGAHPASAPSVAAGPPARIR